MDTVTIEKPATEIKRRSLLKPLLIFFIVMVCIVAVEGGLRLALGKKRIAPPIYASIQNSPGFELAPNSGCTCLEHGRFVQITIDSSGNRLVPNAPDSPGATRIHLVGDSQVFGEGLSDTETFAYKMQSIMGDKFKVINHGVAGYGPFAYQKVLQKIPVEDWVLVIQTEANDLSNSYTRKTGATVRCGYLTPDNSLGNSLPCWFLNLRLFQIGTFLNKGIRKSKRPVPISFDTHDTAASAVLLYRNQELFKKEIQSRGPKILFTYIPWSPYLDRSRLKMYVPTIENPVRSVQYPDDCGLEAALIEAGDPVTLFLPFDDHLSPRGADIAGTVLSRKLQEKIASH